MDSGWLVWFAVLVAWTLVGLVVAYIFGGLARRSEASEDLAVAPKPKVSYLRRQKRTKGPSTETKIRRAAGGRGRH